MTMKWGFQLSSFLFWVLAAVLFFVIAVRLLERFGIYFPFKKIIADPASVGLSYEDVFFETSDRKQLNGWYIPVRGAEDTLLFFHGNAGNIGHRLEKILLLHDLGVNVFIFDYRGYGQSQGSPSEAGLHRDAEAAYEYLTKKRGLQSEQIIPYGESLGGAVAVHLAAGKKVKALVTEGTFTSAKDMARIVLPFVPPGILASRFDALINIKNVDCPMLIIHSLDDETVPYELGEKLFGAASRPKKLLQLRGGHNTAFLDSRQEYLRGLRDFFQGLSGSETAMDVASMEGAGD